MLIITESKIIELRIIDIKTKLYSNFIFRSKVEFIPGLINSTIIIANQIANIKKNDDSANISRIKWLFLVPTTFLIPASNFLFINNATERLT